MRKTCLAWPLTKPCAPRVRYLCDERYGGEKGRMGTTISYVPQTMGMPGSRPLRKALGPTTEHVTHFEKDFYQGRQLLLP